MSAHLVDKGLDYLARLLISRLQHNLLWFSLFHITIVVGLRRIFLKPLGLGSRTSILLRRCCCLLFAFSVRYFQLIEKRVSLVEVRDLVLGQFFPLVLREGLPLLHVVRVLNDSRAGLVESLLLQQRLCSDERGTLGARRRGFGVSRNSGGSLGLLLFFQLHLLHSARVLNRFCLNNFGLFFFGLALGFDGRKGFGLTPKISILPNVPRLALGLGCHVDPLAFVVTRRLLFVAFQDLADVRLSMHFLRLAALRETAGRLEQLVARFVLLLLPLVRI